MRHRPVQLIRQACSRQPPLPSPSTVTPARCFTHWPGAVHQASAAKTQPSTFTRADPGPPPHIGLQRQQQTSSSAILTLHDSVHDITVRVYPTTVSLASAKNALNGTDQEYHFSHVWLRDICTEASSVDASTQQKLFHTSDIAIPDKTTSPNGLLDGTNPAQLVYARRTPYLKLQYSPEYPVVNAFSATFAAKTETASAGKSDQAPHTSLIPLQTLLTHADAKSYAATHADIGGTSVPWEGLDLTSFPTGRHPSASETGHAQPSLDRQEALARPARIAWTDFERDEKLRFAIVNGLMRDGIAFVTELPVDKTGNSTSSDSNDSPSLARLAEKFGEIRNTFYGPLWNVRSLGSSSRNIAYTNVDLGLHMDLCYFQNPPRFQFLHMLRNRVKGGESIFVDSFRVAEEMWRNHRSLWQVLTEVPVGFHYVNDNQHYRYTHPTFEVAASTSGHANAASLAHGQVASEMMMPRLTAINYSPPFQSPLPLHPAMDADKQTRFYKALQIFSDLTLQEQFRYERTLAEGECVIFDNRRVLHSRRGFEWNQEDEGSEEGVKRWLKGCYIDGDAVWSTYRTLLARNKA